jgi:hypothetical protein
VGAVSRDDVTVATAPHPEGTTIRLRIIPRARHTSITGRHGEALKLRVTAPPVDGSANAAVARFLAERCGVRASEVEILAGERSREKVVLVRGVTVATVVHALSNP